MAAQELRWLTYLLTDLGEPPRSPPVLYVDNKAMLALCREQRLEHRTKHIALRYFLARELQQRGQLRLAYVASEANTADVFTKALAPCDHQRCCTQLGLLCFALLDCPYPELVGCLMYLMTCTPPDLAYPLGLLAHYVAPGRHRKAMQRSSQGYTFSLGSGSVSWRSTRSSSVLSTSCEAEIYATAMAAKELRWLTYLLTDLGERPRSPPVLYIDNKATIALCQEHRLEHITKHIALRYFLARELQQHGQLCLAHVATRANTADIFTKALPSGDHRRFCTLLGLLALLLLTGLLTPCSPPLCLWGDQHRVIHMIIPVIRSSAIDCMNRNHDSVGMVVFGRRSAVSKGPANHWLFPFPCSFLSFPVSGVFSWQSRMK
ncbi:unnamed protein product [Closterium sp. NIES-53]